MPEDKNITPEEMVEKAKEWENKIRTEVNDALDIFLAHSINCNVGVQYSHPVIAEYESGPERDMGKVNGAQMVLVFEFAEPVEISTE